MPITCSVPLLRPGRPLMALGFAIAAIGAEPIRIHAVTGLQFDVKQFAVAPGEAVTVEFENTDATDMPHNFVITVPGGREAVVAAALALGSNGAKQGYVPKVPQVLWAIPAVPPEEKRTLAFTAPATAGIYPYVCTLPGHGVIMFGAMYVGVPLPAAAPAAGGEEGEGHVHHEHAAAGEPAAKSPHAYALHRPFLYRTFMPDAGPAAIAVALPGDLNYCWDAGPCRFRYAWTGECIDNTAYWKGNGDGVAKLRGPVVYRAPDGMPLRLAAERDPVAAFTGYRLMQGLPEFSYTLDGIAVRESIAAGPAANTLVFTYRTESDRPLVYRVDPGYASRFTSPVGAFEQGVLRIPAATARSFAITLTVPAAPVTGATP